MGFYNMATGRRAGVQLPRASLRDVRQLPPGGDGRHRRQPHHARHRRRRVLPGRERQRGRPAGRRDREPEPAAGDQQLLHAGRLRRRAGRPTAAATRTARTTRAPGVAGVFDYLDSAAPTRCSTTAMRHRSLLPAEQLQPRLQRRRDARTRRRSRSRRSSRCRRSATSCRRTGSAGGTSARATTTARPGPNYCGICDPMQYSTLDHDQPGAAGEHRSTALEDFDAEATNGTLPAVSFLKPGDDDGHPGYSTLAAFEQFVTHAVDEVQNNPTLWKSTAIFVTFDEGGGYYDSGYVQPVSFFGDGTRVPMVVDLAVREARLHQPRLHRPRLDPEVHRAQLGALAAVGPQHRQPAGPDRRQERSVRPDEPSRDRRPVRLLRLRTSEPDGRSHAASPRRAADEQPPRAHPRPDALTGTRRPAGPWLGRPALAPPPAAWPRRGVIGRRRCSAGPSAAGVLAAMR